MTRNEGADRRLFFGDLCWDALSRRALVSKDVFDVGRAIPCATLEHNLKNGEYFFESLNAANNLERAGDSI